MSKGNSQKGDPVFSHDTETLFAESKLKCSILSRNLLLRESTFHTIKCLKLFGFELFFIQILKLLKSVAAQNQCVLQLIKRILKLRRFAF